MNILSKKVNSLGFLKPAKDTKVVVAMSGGVDSSTVAGIMKKDGYNVIGVTLKLYDDVKSSKKTKDNVVQARTFWTQKGYRNN
jgi:tRNA-specific 2-thiouridylase